MYSQIHCWPINWKFSAQLNTSLAGHYQAFIYLFIFLESKEEMISIGWYLHIVGLGRGQVGGCAAWIMDCSLSCFVCTCCCAFWMNIEAGSGLLWLWRLILIFTWLHCSLCTGCSACVRPAPQEDSVRDSLHFFSPPRCYLIWQLLGILLCEFFSESFVFTIGFFFFKNLNFSF